VVCDVPSDDSVSAEVAIGIGEPSALIAVGKDDNVRFVDELWVA